MSDNRRHIKLSSEIPDQKLEERASDDSSLCFHCGDPCTANDILVSDKQFCCNGCLTVYELLEGSDLCTYYDLDASPGTSPKLEGAKLK